MTHTTMNELALTTTEAALRDKCLAVIRAHRDGFIAAGEALATMRDSRLYRETHATFEEFCREELGMGKSQAYRLIEAAQVASPMGDKSLITTERQARELARVPAPERQAVIAKAQEATGGRITAKAIREAARPMYPVEPVLLSAESQAAAQQAEKDSERLWLLKSTWRKTNKKDRTAFIEWVQIQDQ